MNVTARDIENAPIDVPVQRRSAQRFIVVLMLAVTMSAAVFCLVQNRDTVASIARLVPVESASTVPDFSLTDQQGRTIGAKQLHGQVWVADFVFTRCSGPCPTLSHHMGNLQGEFVRDADVKLVTFTLDPVNDTQPVMADYARRFHADDARWLFLTGPDERAMHELVEKGFLQSVRAATADAPIVHSTYFVVVDRQGRMRAFHDGLDPESRGSLVASVRALLAEVAGP